MRNYSYDTLMDAQDRDINTALPRSPTSSSSSSIPLMVFLLSTSSRHSVDTAPTRYAISASEAGNVLELDVQITSVLTASHPFINAKSVVCGSFNPPFWPFHSSRWIFRILHNHLSAIDHIRFPVLRYRAMAFCRTRYRYIDRVV